MKPLRLIADDLTGALDTAAQFTGPGRVIPVFLGRALPEPLPRDMAVDAATREIESASAVTAMERLAPVLAPGFEATAYRKVDSLLRGHPGIELAAMVRAAPVRYCIIAPAFPLHGRVTRGGRQFELSAGATLPVGEDLRATLQALGIESHRGAPGSPVPEGVSIWDAETDEDLRRIAEAGAGLPGPVLWCGSGGLAAAIANTTVPGPPPLGRPMVGLFGSDHPATGAQLVRCSAHVLTIGGGRADAERVAARLGDAGICLVRCDVPRGMDRAEAASRISGAFERLLAAIPRPASLLVSGGETLRALCQSLGTDHLDVLGQVIPGVPVSRMAGGRWDGTLVVSKSGAFGDDALLQRIISMPG